MKAGDPRDKECYDRANIVLHARFAIAAWPQAVCQGLVQDFDESKTDKLSLPKILVQDQLRKELHLDFRNLDKMTDNEVKCVVEGLPPNLNDLSLIFAGCGEVTDKSLAYIRLPNCLDQFHLRLASCPKVTDKGVESLAPKLPKELRRLSLSFSKCPKVGDPGLLALAGRLPPKLESFILELKECKNITDIGVQGLAKQLPQSLTQINLAFHGCDCLSLASARALASNLRQTPKN